MKKSEITILAEKIERTETLLYSVDKTFPDASPFEKAQLRAYYITKINSYKSRKQNLEAQIHVNQNQSYINQFHVAGPEVVTPPINTQQ